MIMEGVVLGILVAIGVLLLVRWYVGRTDPPAKVEQDISVLDLAYCNDDQVKPCVVSFGTDVDDNMLVNLLLPDLSFPNFYLKITRGDDDAIYDCQRIAPAPNNAYCIGRRLSPGETLHLMLFSTKDDTLLAQGDLPIIGLAFPTLEIAIPTDAPTMTPVVTETTATVIPTSTATFEFVLPTSTGSPIPTFTQPSYPNQSYP